MNRCAFVEQTPEYRKCQTSFHVVEEDALGALTYRQLIGCILVIALTTVGCKTRQSSADSRLLEITPNTEYTGHSIYRLLRVNRPTPDFRATGELLTPSRDELYRERVGEAFWGAAAKSLVPLGSILTGVPSGTEPDLMQLLTMAVTNAKASLKEELEPLRRVAHEHGPAISEVMIVPWLTPREDVFYDAEKISLSATELVNVVGGGVGSPKFATTLTADIKKLQTMLAEQAEQPVYLLAGRQFLFLSSDQAKLTVRILLGLKPFATEFTKEDSRVKFSRIVIPEARSIGPVVSATFEVDIFNETTPKLHLEFGTFDAYKDGLFALDETGRVKSAPRLEGQANKRGTGWVALNFAFKKLTFDMRTAQVTSLNTLLSPGLRIKGSNFVVGGFGVESIDSSFQQEINNTIDSSIQAALTQGNDQILDGMMKKEWLDQAFAVIFGRKQEIQR